VVDKGGLFSISMGAGSLPVTMTDLEPELSSGQASISEEKYQSMT
jgi:hypothetical protein